MNLPSISVDALFYPVQQVCQVTIGCR